MKRENTTEDGLTSKISNPEKIAAIIFHADMYLILCGVLEFGSKHNTNKFNLHPEGSLIISFILLIISGIIGCIRNQKSDDFLYIFAPFLALRFIAHLYYASLIMVLPLDEIFSVSYLSCLILFSIIFSISILCYFIHQCN